MSPEPTARAQCRGPHTTRHAARGPRKPPSRALAREIAWVLSAKTVFLFLLWAAFFGPGNRPAVDPDRVGEALLSPSGPSTAAQP